NTVHDFCDDFDHGPLGATWTQMFTVGGALTLDPLAISPSSALLAQVAPGGGFEKIILQKDFAGATKGIRCNLDMRVDVFDDYTDVLPIEFLEPTDSYFVRIGLGGGANVNEYGQFADAGERVRNIWPFTQPQAGEWFNVTLDLRAEGDAGAAKLLVDQA